MKTRCNNKNCKDYHHYGGRGVFYDQRWEVFSNFYADMGDPPVGMTLDRIDNNGPYSKENCRWATRKQQAENRRSNVFLSAAGSDKTITQLASDLDGNPSLVSDRLRLGWPCQRAVETQKNAHLVRITHNGIEKTCSEWATSLGINKRTLKWRLRQGFEIERVLFSGKLDRKNRGCL